MRLSGGLSILTGYSVWVGHLETGCRALWPGVLRHIATESAWQALPHAFGTGAETRPVAGGTPATWWWIWFLFCHSNGTEDLPSCWGQIRKARIHTSGSPHRLLTPGCTWEYLCSAFWATSACFSSTCGTISTGGFRGQGWRLPADESLWPVWGSEFTQAPWRALLWIYPEDHRNSQGRAAYFVRSNVKWKCGPLFKNLVENFKRAIAEG